MANNKRKIVEGISRNEQEIQGTIIFMTAYNIHNIKHHFPHFGRQDKLRDLLNKYHISGISNKEVYTSSDAKCHYKVEYDSLNQVSSFEFEENIPEINNEAPQFYEEMMTTLLHHHSANALLDTSQINVSFCFNMESFLVVFDTKTFQVNAVAIVMNDSIIVNFELIDFDSTTPLKYDAIYGRKNNYGIHPISKIKYFNEQEFSEDNRKISDIIFRNVFDFINKSCKDKWEFNDFSYVHNTLVVSNEIECVSEYFQNVVGIQIDEYNVDDISTTNAFSYYSTESMGVVTRITSDSINGILFDCMMLESLKVYLLLKMIIDYEVNHELDKIIDSQIYVESLFYPSCVPAITLNVIDNLKGTISFSRYKQAVDFKVRALKLQQDRKYTSNGRLLNILLYILAMIGSAQTLEVLKTEFGLPFKLMFWLVMGVFVIFGVMWAVREIKK